MDTNRDAEVHDEEWKNFYDLFVKPFQLCDTSGDDHLSETGLANCFTSD